MKCKTNGKFGEFSLKIDISKVFEQAEWNYLFVLMLKLGFDAKWVG